MLKDYCYMDGRADYLSYFISPFNAEYFFYLWVNAMRIKHTPKPQIKCTHTCVVYVTSLYCI